MSCTCHSQTNMNYAIYNIIYDISRYIYFVLCKSSMNEIAYNTKWYDIDRYIYYRCITIQFNNMCY